MNPLDLCLERLFRAARAAHDLPCEPPFGLETRVLGAWRSGGTQEDDDGLLWLPLVRAATLFACVVIVISAALTFSSDEPYRPNDVVIMDSAIQLTLMQ